MSNQFDSELRWIRTESFANHARTQSTALLKDYRIGVPREKWPPKPWYWSIVSPGGSSLEGWSASEASARAAVRRRLAKLPTAELDPKA